MMKNDTQFEKGLAEIRRVVLKPEEKGMIFRNLSHYAEKHPVQSMPFYLAIWKFIRGFFSAKLPTSAATTIE